MEHEENLPPQYVIWYPGGKTSVCVTSVLAPTVPGPLPDMPRTQGNKELGENLGHDFLKAESQVAKTNFFCLS